MYKCSECKKSFLEVKFLIKHIKKKCENNPSHLLHFSCAQEKCLRHFDGEKSFRAHLKMEHKQKETQIRSSLNVETPGNLSFHIEDLYSQDTDSDHLSSTNSGLELRDDIESKLVLIISSLYANPRVPRNVVQIFIESYMTYFSKKETYHQDQLDILSQKEIISLPLKEFVHETIFFDRNMFESFQSDYMRMKYFSDKGTYISPVEVSIGERSEMRRRQNQPSSVKVSCSLQIIPVSAVLQNFFSMKNVLRDTLAFIEYVKDMEKFGIYANIMHGSTWHNWLSQTQGDSDLHFPFILYEDDFETSNPLGTKAGTYKLGGVYISIPCLPPKYFSSLNCIFTLALFHTSDRVAFGNHLVFEPVIKELNSLSTVGITVDTNVYKGVIKFHIAALTADNLGIHGLIGFAENFNANYVCRICSANKNQVHSLLFENSSLLRNVENYESHVLLNNVTLTGIKERCIWLRLHGFKLFDHTAVDMMHDFLEGVCRYTMQFVIKELVFKRKIIGIELLLSNIRHFDFGPDSDSKPIDAIFVTGSSFSLKTSASEMLNLVRYFALIVGQYVPEELQSWSLFLYLRRLLDKLLCSKFSKGNIIQVEYLIAAHNELYQELAETHLKPKHHFMTHYGGMIKKFGPLLQTWTMRFEARHKIGKLAARSSTNRRNICKTIAIKNQLILNDMFLRNEPFVEMSCALKRKLLKKDKESILEKFICLQTENSALYSVVWVKKLGNTFRKNDIITTSISHLDLPVFAKIAGIVITDNEDVFFKGIPFDTICFDSHLHAYEVDGPYEEFEEWFSLSKLISLAPSTLTFISSQQYVTQRLPID